MSTLADTTPQHTSTWRQIALVTLLVVLAHAALLVALPPWGAREAPLPLEQRFVTRTIEIPAPAPPEAPAPQVPRPVPRKAPEHRATQAPRSAAPHAAPPEAPEPPAAVLATPDPSAEQARVETAPTPPDAPAAGTAAPINEAGAAGGTAGGFGGEGEDAGDIATGLPRPGHTMPVHASVRLGFEAVGQRGVQPWRGAFGELVWLQDGDQYNARMSLKIFFKTINTWTSTGRIGETGLAPERFSETKRSEVASHFVRDQGKVVFSNNSPTTELKPGAQDRLSVTMQLGALLAGDPQRYPQGSHISIQTVGPKDAEVWTFVVEADEHITTPAGEFDVRRLSRTPRNEHDYKLELWLAPELGWLPARMRQTMQDGDIIDLLLRDISPP